MGSAGRLGFGDDAPRAGLSRLQNHRCPICDDLLHAARDLGCVVTEADHAIGAQRLGVAHELVVRILTALLRHPLPGGDPSTD